MGTTFTKGSRRPSSGVSSGSGTTGKYSAWRSLTQAQRETIAAAGGTAAQQEAQAREVRAGGAAGEISIGLGTYDPNTFTYTSPEGDKMSMAPEHVPKGTITLKLKKGTYHAATFTYTSPTGAKQSMALEHVPKGTTIIGKAEPVRETPWFSGAVEKFGEIGQKGVETGARGIEAVPWLAETLARRKKEEVAGEIYRPESRFMKPWEERKIITEGIVEEVEFDILKEGDIIYENQKVELEDELELLRLQEKINTGEITYESAIKIADTVVAKHKRWAEANLKEYINKVGDEERLSKKIRTQILNKSKNDPLLTRVTKDIISKYEKEIKPRYEVAEEKVRGLTYKYMPPPEKVLSSEKELEKAMGVVPFSPKWEKQFFRFSAGKLAGYYTGIRDKPLKTALMAGTFFALPGVLKGAGAIGKGVGLGKVAGMYPKTASALSKAFSIGLPTAYLGVTGYRIAKEPTAYKRGFKFGEIVTTELAPMIIGGVAGTKFWSKFGGYVRTAGMKKIPEEKLIPKEVLLGRKRFIEHPKGIVSQKEYLKMFLKGAYRLPGGTRPIGYHAFPGKFVGKVVKPGTSEIPGLYVAPGVSPHFLKIGKAKFSLYGGKLFTPYGTPGVMAVTPKRFVMGLPKTQKLGLAYIPGTKPEVEAVLSVGTKLTKGTPFKRFYFKWEGVRTPIYEYGVAGVGAGNLRSQTLKALSSYYKIPSTYYVTTPGTYLAGLTRGMSYKPSKVSYKPSVISYKPLSYRPYDKYYGRGRSYRPSRVVSYKPSIVRYPSYKPPTYIYPAYTYKYPGFRYGLRYPQDKPRRYTYEIIPPPPTKYYKQKRWGDLFPLAPKKTYKRKYRYQPAVGAVMLGFVAGKKYIKRIEKAMSMKGFKFTGVEHPRLRGQIPERVKARREYLKRINKLFK